MALEASWLDALKLPTKIKASIALACTALYYLFAQNLILLDQYDSLVQALLLIGAVVAGIFVAVDVVVWLCSPLTQKRQRSLLAERRADRRNEELAERDTKRAMVLERLNHLSNLELSLVAQALTNNSPTVYTWVNSSAVGAMLGKGLLWSPGSSHHQDHYPFTFHDFVWAEVLRRKEEFLDRSSEAAAKSK